MGDQGRRRVDVGLEVQLPGRNDLLMVSFRELTGDGRKLSSLEVKNVN